MKIVDTTLRDGQQSLLATRMTTKEILSVLPELDNVGFYALEVWGGATFDSAIRFLKEDPWERLKKIKKIAKKTKLQMLLRGQNLVGYRHYSDDVVRLFIQRAINFGIDIVRIFDALNDFRNIEVAVDETIKCGAHCQIAIAYTISDIHTTKYYVDLAKKAEMMGAHSICIKDMAGLLLPNEAFKLINSLKKVITIPINLHSHSTTGMISATYLKSIEAGVDIIDTSLSPLSGGTSQIAADTIHYILENMNLDSPINLNKLKISTNILKNIINDYIAKGKIDPLSLFPRPEILIYQVPGGMLSNLISQLKEQRMLDRFEDILKEIPHVRKDFGYPPLVTPVSQFVGVQATINVISGKRYSSVPKEVKSYIKGLYGSPPSPIKKDFIKKILGDENIITHRASKELSSPLNEIKMNYSNYITSNEDLLTIALFDDVALKFLENRAKTDDNYISKIKKPKIHIRFMKNIVENNKYCILMSPTNGYVKKVYFNIKDKVKKGDKILLLNFDNFTIELLSPLDGFVEEINVSEGMSINSKVDKLVKIKIDLLSFQK